MDPPEWTQLLRRGACPVLAAVCPAGGGQDGTDARHHTGPLSRGLNGSGCCSQQSVRDQESGVHWDPWRTFLKAGPLQPQACSSEASVPLQTQNLEESLSLKGRENTHSCRLIVRIPSTAGLGQADADHTVGLSMSVTH